MNVGTPRFFIDWFQFLQANGQGKPSAPDFFGLNPTSGADGAFTGITYRSFETDTPIPNINYFAILGHGMDTNTQFDGRFLDKDGGVLLHLRDFQLDNAVNLEKAEDHYWSQYQGFSIALITKDSSTSLENMGMFDCSTNDVSVQINAFSLGTYYDMPHSPDLNLTMSREYGGTKETTTRGGSTLSNTMWNRPPNWAFGAPWELYDTDETIALQPLAKTGRRTWSLSFSFLGDSDMFPMVSTLTPYESTSATGVDYESGASDPWFPDNLLPDADTFYNKVINRTMGANNSSFIFQPDSLNFNPDQFAICKFDQKSFSLQETAPGLYSLKCKIREVW